MKKTDKILVTGASGFIGSRLVKSLYEGGFTDIRATSWSRDLRNDFEGCENVEFLKGDPLNNNDDIFAGIDTSWNRIKGGNLIGDILYKVENNFNFKDPSVHIPQLIEAYKLLQNVKDEHWKTIKTKEIKAFC